MEVEVVILVEVFDNQIYLFFFLRSLDLHLPRGEIL